MKMRMVPEYSWHVIIIGLVRVVVRFLWTNVDKDIIAWNFSRDVQPVRVEAGITKEISACVLRRGMKKKRRK